ncbi:MAG: hypothetical protein HC767_04575 [Akkermansiaceae bacterium]|nr:hypothetical protein [Akkermansiaceae bacterium]
MVMLSDSDDEPAEQDDLSELEPARRPDDGGSVDLLSESDESAASESEAEEEPEVSVFPDSKALFLDMPERYACLQVAVMLSSAWSACSFPATEQICMIAAWHA